MRTLSILASTFSLVFSSPLSSRQSPKVPFFLLVGDSTTAIGGGWGDGFLNHTLKAPASGLNYGHSGATTVSFRAGGDWATVLSQITTHQADSSVYVTIQFGHNDQKAAANISLEQFSQNLGVFVDEVRDAGGEPILITSLTRRVFSGDPPLVVQSLANERVAAISVAEAKSSKYIDLNIASEDYCNAIGPEASWRYNLFNATRQGDTTHLNEWGGTVFGRLVSDLLVEKYEEVFGDWTAPNATLSALLEEGLPA
ncbi:carbohydrate esterase family 12 protein [Zasmidium cellare ATCC 36951]|uniref:Carbohydrate esterase family 12 protein n=1 Tax=Zasmidium cellare ATCC 36951 TaxID=1080233 RepID=A0A6A6CB43_ZASCE|nr:carbohydrate esterase family 12 protein [Zasmidium cellare ATCC 36951]KAF2164013.1 carbohydrate esterase family 12 protein [Zasmidium cellare ATCC 36951]